MNMQITQIDNDIRSYLSDINVRLKPVYEDSNNRDRVIVVGYVTNKLIDHMEVSTIERVLNYRIRQNGSRLKVVSNYDMLDITISLIEPRD